MDMKCTVAVLVAAIGTSAATEAPAVEAAITQKALDFAVKVGVPMLERDIKSMSIASQSFDKDSFEGSVRETPGRNCRTGGLGGFQRAPFAQGMSRVSPPARARHDGTIDLKH